MGGVVLLEPGPISVESADETVHLRFLAGASVTPAHLPTFLETAGPVGNRVPAVRHRSHPPRALGDGRSRRHDFRAG